MRLRVVFFGTPEFAVPSLQALLDRGEDVAAVVCQPDRPAGRGQKLVPPPVKVLAEKHGVAVLQPEKLRTPEVLAALRALAPELIVVAAYGKILAADVLHLPPRGCINVHASLLPRHRGAAPIQWAILRGDARTGVTIMQMDEGMDTGAMLLQRETEIGSGETYGELQGRLSHLGAAALGEALDLLGRGELHATSQDEAGATLAPKIEKEQGRIDWSSSAEEIERQVRAFNPWPSAYTALAGQLLKVHRATVYTDAFGDEESAPGRVLAVKNALVVACGREALRLDEVQLSGKQRLAGTVFALGARLAVGAHLG
jgi:methionyl-tRNA formyltransferase